jgi:hypothetical protein
MAQTSVSAASCTIGRLLPIVETGFVSGRADILPPFASDGGIRLNLGELIGVVVPDVKLSLGMNNQDNVSHLKHGLVGQSQGGGISGLRGDK